jgi:hypothetical protein
MNENLMNTQTGGEGETIQLQTVPNQTPEQFDVNISAPSPEPTAPSADVAPTPAPEPVVEQPQVATVPTEQESIQQESIQTQIPYAPVQTEITTTEQQTPEGEEVKTDVSIEEKKAPEVVSTEGKQLDITPLPSGMSIMTDQMQTRRSELDINNPYVNNISLLTPSVDVFGQQDIVNTGGTYVDDSDIAFASEADKEEYERNKELESMDPAVQQYVQAVDQTQKEIDEDPATKQMNEIISKGRKQGRYEDVLSRVASSTDDTQTFKDVDVPTIKFDKMKVSSNYNNWADLMGVNEQAIDELATGSIINQGFENKAMEISSIMSKIDKSSDNINAIQESLSLGIVTPEAHRLLVESNQAWVQPNGKIDSTTRSVLNQKMREYKKNETQLKRDLLNVKDEKPDLPPKPTAPVSMLDQFEKRVNTDLKSIYAKKWEFVGKDQGIPFYKSPAKLGLSSDGFTKDDISTPTKIAEIKNQAKWLDQEGRSLIQQSVAKGDPTIFFNNPQVKNMEPGLIEYARDIFEVEYNKDFKKNGGVDPYTYDGFKRVASKMAKENSKKLNGAIADDANEVVENVKDLNEKWVNTNKSILNKKIDDTKKAMDEILTGDIMSEIQRNPQAAAIRDKYAELIQSAPTKEDAAKLNSQMMSELKQIPNIAKSFGEYQENLDDAVFKLQADYHREWYSFRQDLYTNSINDLKTKIGKSTMEVYRSGINNDLNIYQGQSNVKDPDKIPLGANGVVSSKKFKEAPYYEKRKMISSQWEVEKSAIINYTNQYIKNNKERYPATKEEASKHWSEWTGVRAISDKEKNQWLASMPERTGSDAKNRYIFYAIDDLLYTPDPSKPTVFGVKSFADAELDKIRYLEQKFGFTVGDHIGDYGETRQKLPISQKEEQQLLTTKKMLEEIVSHPETDQEWYNEMFRGIYDGFDIPILGAFVGIQRNQNMREAIEKYQNGTFDSFDISMTEAQAALNKLNEIRPPSTAYQIGSGLGFTTTFMLEMAMTGGINQVGQSVGKTLVETVSSLAKTTTDDVVRAAAERATPATINRAEKVTSFIVGGMMEGAANPRAYEDYTRNMIQNITIQELGTYDGLIAKIDSQSKSDFSEFVKAYGNWMGMATIERLGGHMPTSNISKEVLEYMGTDTFLKRTVVGAWFRSSGFKSIDEASEYLATTSMPWSNFTYESGEELIQGSWDSLMYGEQMFGPERKEDGTKELKFFGMTPQEIKVTAGSVALFGAGSTMVRNARMSISSDTVTLEAEDIDGTSQITQIDRQTWDKFNGIIGDKNLSWQAVSRILQESDLTVEQERVLATAFIKTRGIEITVDPAYQQWKSENAKQIEANKEVRSVINEKLEEAEAKLTPEEKALRDYEFMTTGLQYDNEGNPMNYWESLTAGGFFNLVNLNEDVINDANMPIVERDQDGNVVSETNAKEKADELANKSKKNQEERAKTPNGKKKKEEAEAKTKKANEPQPSSFTEPVEITNTEENDQENKPGVSSQVGEGEKPVETKPVTQTGEETPSVSGVVQGEQKVAIGETVEVNGKKYTKVETSLVGEPKGTAYQGEDGVSYNTEWVEKNMTPKAATVTEPVGKTEELPTTEANPFEELADTIKLKGTAKTNAIKALKQKYGADYNRISKIDTNFASIVKTLEKNNLINKDCG